MGKIVKTYMFKWEVGQTITLILSDLSPGVYLVRLQPGTFFKDKILIIK